jgi:exosortase
MVLWIGVDALRWDWTINPQYSYGWLVPLLGGYLFLKRWPSRPPSTGRGQRGVGWALGVLGMALLPLRLIRESSPDWTPVRWGISVEVVLCMLGMLALGGGLRQVRHFAWPVGFFLVAVPWPPAWENALTQGLMQRVAAVTAEVVGWAGYAAQAQGNLISLGTGTVGVDEACSGVRSLQSMLMASIFLGELLRLGVLRRVVLVGAGLGLALFFNLLRSLILVSVAIRSGLGELEKWHDSAGLTILVASFGVLVCVSKILQGPVEEESGGDREGLELTGGWILGIAAWLLFVEGFTEVWYRSRERGRELVHGWTVRWPREYRGYRRNPVSDGVRKILAYEKGDGADWGEPGGEIWRMFFFEWAAGRTSSQAARVHRPEICLPATGRTLERELEPIEVRCGGVELPFRAYLFNNSGKPMYVYFCLWEAGNQDLEGSGLSQEWSGKARLERVWAGRRNLGQQSLELIAQGFSDAAAAEAGLRRVLERILVSEGK